MPRAIAYSGLLIVSLFSLGCEEPAATVDATSGAVDLSAFDATTPTDGADAPDSAGLADGALPVDGGDVGDGPVVPDLAPDLAPGVPPLTGTPISPLLFGVNAWMPDAIGAAHKGGQLAQRLCGADYEPGVMGQLCVPSEISEAGVQIMRYGGIANDKNFDVTLSYAQHLELVTNLRALGIEPIVQVSYAAGTYTAAQAAGLVEYLNVTHALGVVYWSIGNEPNMTDAPYSGEYGAQKISAYIKEFAAAMKNVDPSIRITGVDLNSYNATIMNGLTDGTYDITGTFIGDDGAPHYYVDDLNFHTYKFSGDPDVRQEMIDYPAGGFAQNLALLRARVDLANTNHGRTGDAALTMSVTEINVGYRNPIYVTDDATIRGVGAQSFLAGQFWANALHMGMKHGLRFMTFWSVAEGGGPDGELDLGMLDNGTLAKRSTYHHFQMLATSFRGVYAPATWTLDGHAENNVTAFASRDLDRIAVMILNQKSATSMAYSVRLDGAAASGDHALNVAVAAETPREYHSPDAEPLPPQSTVLLVFDGTGTLERRTVYRLDDALAEDGGDPPTTYSY